GDGGWQGWWLGVGRAVGRYKWRWLNRRGFDMCGSSKGALRRIACISALLAASASVALAQGATLRLGYGTAAEEPIWLVVAKPDLGKNQGKAYTLDATRFTGSDKRGQAFEAGPHRPPPPPPQRPDFSPAG